MLGIKCIGIILGLIIGFVILLKLIKIILELRKNKKIETRIINNSQESLSQGINRKN